MGHSSLNFDGLCCFNISSAIRGGCLPPPSVTLHDKSIPLYPSLYFALTLSTARDFSREVFVPHPCYCKERRDSVQKALLGEAGSNHESCGMLSMGTSDIP